MLFTGKLPMVPGAGADIKPDFNFDVATLPAEFNVMSRIAGLTKKTPDGVLNSPTFFLNSSNEIPTSCAPLFVLELVNVERPEEMKNGGLLDHTAIAPIVQPPTSLLSAQFEVSKKRLPFPNGSS